MKSKFQPFFLLIFDFELNEKRSRDKLSQAKPRWKSFSSSYGLSQFGLGSSLHPRYNMINNTDIWIHFHCWSNDSQLVVMTISQWLECYWHHCCFFLNEQISVSPKWIQTQDHRRQVFLQWISSPLKQTNANQQVLHFFYCNVLIGWWGFLSNYRGITKV